ncbi:MAG: LPS export ABC transporter periplasmic protein LptC [bacterium]
MKRGRGRSIAAAGLVALCFGCGSALEGLDPEPPTAMSLPPAELSGVVFEGYRGELRDLSVTSEKAVVDMVRRVASLDDEKLSFSEESRGKLEVGAPHGEFKLDADDFVLTGGVVGSAQEGERFSTDSVHYVAAKRELVSTTPVELRRENLVLRADGMQLGLDQRRLKMIGKVEARVVPH